MRTGCKRTGNRRTGRRRTQVGGQGEGGQGAEGQKTHIAGAGRYIVNKKTIVQIATDIWNIL